MVVTLAMTSGDIGYDFKGANVKYYDNHVTEKMKNLKNI